MGCGSSAAAHPRRRLCSPNHFGQLHLVRPADPRRGLPPRGPSGQRCCLLLRRDDRLRDPAETKSVEPVLSTSHCNLLAVTSTGSLLLALPRQKPLHQRKHVHCFPTLLHPRRRRREHPVDRPPRRRLCPTGRVDLLAVAMRDRMHQPFRASASVPSFPLLLPLELATTASRACALSGAGPAVLLIASPNTPLRVSIQAVH